MVRTFKIWSSKTRKKCILLMKILQWKASFFRCHHILISSFCLISNLKDKIVDCKYRTRYNLNVVFQLYNLVISNTWICNTNVISLKVVSEIHQSSLGDSSWWNPFITPKECPAQILKSMNEIIF
jgi:hypothetical protein